jgi:hypothetical protein
MSQNKIFSVLVISVLLTIHPDAVLSAKSETIRQKVEKFNRQKIQPLLDRHQIKVKFTYSPPKVPVSLSCDRSGQNSISFTPRFTTPLGDFGMAASRQLHRLKCPRI